MRQQWVAALLEQRIMFVRTDRYFNKYFVQDRLVSIKHVCPLVPQAYAAQGIPQQCDKSRGVLDIQGVVKMEHHALTQC